MMKCKIALQVCIYVLFLGIFSICADGVSPETIQVIQVAADAQSALVKRTDAKPVVVHTGDYIESLGYIDSISNDRIVIKGLKGDMVVISFRDGRQKLFRAHKRALQNNTPLVIKTTVDGSGRAVMDANVRNNSKDAQ